jgi:hypothetical protein
MGVLKKSLQTWHRRADSRGARPASGVDSQSVLSGTEAEAESKDSIVIGAERRDESRNLDPQQTATYSDSLGLCRLISKTDLRQDAVPRIDLESSRSVLSSVFLVRKYFVREMQRRLDSCLQSLSFFYN